MIPSAEALHSCTKTLQLVFNYTSWDPQFITKKHSRRLVVDAAASSTASTEPYDLNRGPPHPSSHKREVQSYIFSVPLSIGRPLVEPSALLAFGRLLIARIGRWFHQTAPYGVLPSEQFSTVYTRVI